MLPLTREGYRLSGSLSKEKKGSTHCPQLYPCHLTFPATSSAPLLPDVNCLQAICGVTAVLCLGTHFMNWSRRSNHCPRKTCHRSKGANGQTILGVHKALPGEMQWGFITRQATQTFNTPHTQPPAQVLRLLLSRGRPASGLVATKQQYDSWFNITLPQV